MLFAENAAKSFGAVDVLDSVSFIVGDGEHAGLVGPNGSGKSTILRLLAGEHVPDGGDAGWRGGAIGYLRQEAGLADDNLLVEELWLAFPEAHAIERELAAIAHRIERGEGDLDELIHEQARLFEAFETHDGYRIDARIGRVLDGLGFEHADREKRCSEFSGGWQMRIALAKVLVRRPENMLLDEPTNHLDARARKWLAEELEDYPGTLLMVTHDGAFLDRVATRILDLRDGTVDSYAGNYRISEAEGGAPAGTGPRRGPPGTEFAKQERFIREVPGEGNKDERRPEPGEGAREGRTNRAGQEGGGGPLRHRRSRANRTRCP
ncbi:MAG: ABC-F family ATP-binding cassette domain-containing protein [Thermoflexaceae bacterium]|nr:ABC-F family ATP-binding cassette domain-containing protein [Thermoflexaceae bacterium]